MKKNLKNAVTYSRVATRESPTRENCIEQQQQVLNDFAAKNGFIVSDNFYDIGVIKPMEREGFRKLIKAIEGSNGAITHILVVGIDRITRNPFQYFKVEATLKTKYGITIEAAKSSPIPEALLLKNDNSNLTYESENNPTIKKTKFTKNRRSKAITGNLQIHSEC